MATIQDARVEVTQTERTIPALAAPVVLQPLIMGPCYAVYDYADTAVRADLLLGTYGSPNAASDGSTNGRPETEDVVFSETQPPAHVAGAILDHDSVRLLAVNPVVELGTGTDGVRGTTDPNRTRFTSATGNFLARAIARGDVLILTDDADNTVRKTVEAVVSATELRTRSDMTASELSGTATGISWRIERALTSNLDVTTEGVTLAQNGYTVRGGIEVSVALSTSVTATVPLATASLYLEYRELRTDLTDVLAVAQTSEITALLGRADERNPLAVGVLAALRNSAQAPVYCVGVEGDDLQGAQDREASYAAALGRLDTTSPIYSIVPLTEDSVVISAVADHVAAYSEPAKSVFRMCIASGGDLPLTKDIGDSGDAVGELVSSAGYSIVAHQQGQFSDGNVAPGDTLVLLGPDGDPRALNLTVIYVLDNGRVSVTGNQTEETADIVYYVRRGTQGARLRSVAEALLWTTGAGQGRLTPVSSVASPESYVGSYATFDSNTPVTEQDQDWLLLSWENDAPTAATRTLGGIVYTAQDEGVASNAITIRRQNPGSSATLLITVSGKAITIRLAHNGSAITTTATELVAALTDDENAAYNAAAAALITAAVVSGQGSTVQAADGSALNLTGAVSPGWAVRGPYDTPTTAGGAAGSAQIRRTIVSVVEDDEVWTRAPYARLYDASGEFLQAPVVEVGDHVRVAYTEDGFDGSVSSAPVSSVLSDQRVVVASGYEVRVDDPYSSNAGSETVTLYKIVRSLTQAGQVAQHASAQTLSSRRVVLVYPGRCGLTGVGNGRLPGTRQLPGYYLAACIAGRLAGRPAHTPMRNQALSGVTRVYRSPGTLTADQMLALGQAGYMVIFQDGQSVKIRYEVTTNTAGTDLEANVPWVANLDYVSRRLKGVLDRYTQEAYTINPAVLPDVKADLVAALESLKLQKYPNIGAAVTSYESPTVSVSTSEPGTILAEVQVELPRSLDKIKLTIQASAFGTT